jgi:hypothetical protein
LTPEFYKPENYELEISTHNSIRNMLFYQTTLRIKKIEFFHLKKESDYFQFKHLENITSLNVFDKIIDYIKFKFFNKKIIGIKRIVYDRNNKERIYKAKYYHDLNKENFYVIIYPYNLFDKIINIYYRQFGKFE